MHDTWAYWTVGGILLMLAELAFGAFFIFWFGLGALVVALLTVLMPGISFVVQILIWIVASLVFVVLWFKVFKTSFFASRAGTAQNVVGEIGLVTREIQPFQRGMVQFQKPVLGDDKWEAMATEAIAAGERVQIVEVAGNFVKVKTVTQRS